MVRALFWIFTFSVSILIGMTDVEKQQYIDAIKSEKIQVIEPFIKKFGVNAELGQDKRTPIYYAVIKDNREVVKYLIEHGADITLKDATGYTPYALANLYKTQARHYLNGSNPLHWAVMENNFEQVKKVLQERPGLINSIDKDKQTPLHYAASKENNDIIKYLIEHGADSTLKDSSNRTAYDLAKLYKNMQAQPYLNGSGPLHWAVLENNLEHIKKLLDDNPALINSTDHDGKTPLHYAVMKNNLTIITYLIEKGAPINAKDKKGNTPLHESASRSENQKIIKYLIEHGADSTLKDSSNRTAYDLAKLYKNMQAGYYLNGSNPLHWAVRENNFEQIKKVLQERPDLINSIDKDKETPLHYAENKNYRDIVIYLIDHGADLTLKDSTGRTAYDLAHFLRHDETAYHVASDKLITQGLKQFNNYLIYLSRKILS